MGAAVHAPAASRANPRRSGLHHFVHHAEWEHANDLAGVQTFNARRAGGRAPIGAGAAGEAKTRIEFIEYVFNASDKVGFRRISCISSSFSG